MRNGVASLIMGVSLVIASFTWSGLVLRRTVLDPQHSERLAEVLIDDPAVRQALSSRLTEAVIEEIPAELAVSRQTVESGTAAALDDPQVRRLLIDGLIDVHRQALAGVDTTVSVDAEPLGVAAARSLADQRPELADTIPRLPLATIEMPTGFLSALADLDRAIDRYLLVGFAVATSGIGLTLLVARSRARVLRKVAGWGLGSAAFWLIAGFGVPALFHAVAPTSAAVAAAAIEVFLGSMIGPALVMAVLSTALFAGTFAVPRWERRRALARFQPRQAG
jgi:hypothetical protein